MSITLNTARVGNFTSSQIGKLTTTGRGAEGFGSGAITYINEKYLERQLGRSLGVEMDSKVTSWGHLCEIRVNDLLGLEYQHRSNKTVIHPEYDFWSGSCDFIVPERLIAECKAYQPKNFTEYSLAIVRGDIDFLRSEFSMEFWQAVSNAIINQVPIAELICYMPFEFELDEIRQLARDMVEQGKYQYKWIIDAEKQYLPYVPNESKMRSFNRFQFEVLKSDVDFLTERVIKANKLLTKTK